MHAQPEGNTVGTGSEIEEKLDWNNAWLEEGKAAVGKKLRKACHCAVDQLSCGFQQSQSCYPEQLVNLYMKFDPGPEALNKTTNINDNKMMMMMIMRRRRNNDVDNNDAATTTVTMTTKTITQNLFVNPPLFLDSFEYSHESFEKPGIILSTKPLIICLFKHVMQLLYYNSKYTTHCLSLVSAISK